MPTDETVVETAADAAESVVFSRLDPGAIEDVDVTITFEEGVLDVDVYLYAPDERGVERVADDAALAARSAVDDLFAGGNGNGNADPDGDGDGDGDGNAG